MKIRAAFFFLFFLYLNTISYSQHFYHIFDLRGFEDYNNNTQLYYRYGYLYNNFLDCWWKNLYHYDIEGGIDSVFIWDSAGPDPWYGGCYGQSVGDFDFYDNDPQKYIWGGGDLYIDPVPILMRYDGEVYLEAFGYVSKIQFSKQTDSLVYVSVPPAFFKSTDNGYNFERLDTIAWIRDAMISLSENDDSHIYGIDFQKLLRSENEAKTYQVVDEDERWGSWRYNYNLYYDIDGQHIYGVCNSPTESALIFSNGNGDSSSWNTQIVYNGYLSFAHDKLNSGQVYYSQGKKIYQSNDYGESFDLILEFETDVTGLCKKPGSDVLFVATSHNIFQTNPDSVSLILTKPNPDYLLKYYPLSIGNVWVYNQKVIEYWTGKTINSYYKRSVVGDTTMPNGKLYRTISEYDGYPNQSDIFYERIDQSSYKICRFAEDSIKSNQEYLLDDLLVFLGDTIKSYRYYPHLFENRIAIYENANWFYGFGLKKPRIQFNTHSGTINEFNYFLASDIGLDSFYIDKLDLYTSYFDLKGCVINGVVYGDTTVVSVEDIEPMVASSFKLEQNYPNPFNPITKIKFTIPTLLNPPFAKGGKTGGSLHLKCSMY